MAAAAVGRRTRRRARDDQPRALDDPRLRLPRPARHGRAVRRRRAARSAAPARSVHGGRRRIHASAERRSGVARLRRPGRRAGARPARVSPPPLRHAEPGGAHRASLARRHPHRLRRGHWRASPGRAGAWRRRPSTGASRTKRATASTSRRSIPSPPVCRCGPIRRSRCRCRRAGSRRPSRSSPGARVTTSPASPPRPATSARRPRAAPWRSRSPGAATPSGDSARTPVCSKALLVSPRGDILFGRAELNGKPSHALHIHEQPFAILTVGKIQGGYVRQLAPRGGVQLGLGGAVSAALVPPSIRPHYGGVGTGVAVFASIRPASP